MRVCIRQLMIVVLTIHSMFVPSAELFAAGGLRIKDITDVDTESSSPLTGLGLVSGLAGTGGTTPVTREFALNLLQRFGTRAEPILRRQVRLDAQQRTDNLSVVAVTGYIRSTYKKGRSIQVTVSALDDAESLQGGVLLSTPLVAVDGNIYALASGPITIGGFSFSGNAATVQKNHPTTGIGQAIIQENVPTCDLHVHTRRLLLHNPDHTTAVRIAEAINTFMPGAATPEDAGTVLVSVPKEHRATPSYFISEIQQLPIRPDNSAKVVINDRTGTVVIGSDVRLSEVAISHANLSISTSETPEVSQPQPFSQGQTVVVPRTEIEVVEETAPITVLPEPTTVADLARALNALGVTPRDLSNIFRSLQEAGALHAEIIVK